jgi:hypothetical protein
MRWFAVVILAGALLLGNMGVALANKVPCKQIKEAIAAGKTPAQVASELGAKPKRVENCTSGKKKKSAETAQAPAAGQAAPSKGGAAGDEEDED